MFKKYKLSLPNFVIGLVLGGLIGVFIGLFILHRPNNVSQKIGIYPSIFMTGSDGKISTIHPMVVGLETFKGAKAKQGLQFIVNSNNSLQVSGTITKDNHYPTIEIGMVDGTNSSVKVEAAIVAVLKYLEAHYDVQYYNMLGFSAGSTGVYRYLIDHSNDRSLPAVKKWVSLDGQYNASTPQPTQTLDDVLKNGPVNKTKWYLTETDLYQKFSSTVQVAMLAGQYGNPAHQTDGVVPWADTFSIYHLLIKNGNPVSRYICKGDNTYHADMPKNKEAIAFVENFFYE